MNYIKIISLLLYSFLSFGQQTTVDLVEINNYTKFIDSTSKKHKEGISEGPIIYKNLFRKNGGWEAYYLTENSEVDRPLRIRYSESGFQTNESINIYYKSVEIIFAEFTQQFKRGKNKKSKPKQTQFYFMNGKLIHQTNKEVSNFSLIELMRRENEIRKYYYKK